MTGLEAVYRITKRLETDGFEDAAFEATQMVRQVSNRNMFTELNAGQVGQLKEIVLRRLTHEPLQYILGEWDFYGLTFKVGPGVLIPRQDTEMLVDLAIRELKMKPYTTAIDLCAGTGCIGISLAANLPYTHVSLLEKSDEAFEFLKENVKMHLPDAKNIELIKGDVTEEHIGKYSLIVSNPPYIKSDLCKQLQYEVQQEPLMALDGGEDGLFFYRKIVEIWAPKLFHEGKLMVEIGYDQGEAVAEIFKAAGLVDVEVKKDLCGNSRVVIGTWLVDKH